MSYKLVRLNDGLVKHSLNVKFIEFDEEGKFKKDFEEPAIGRSLLMSPFNMFFTWQTTTITEIIESDPLHFKTSNSEYKLYKDEDL